MDEAEFLKRLLETFRIEAREHIEIIGKGMIELEKDLNDEKKQEVLEEIYRSAHSMKGASRAVNLIEAEKLCQSLENCFALLKKNELQLSGKVFDIFHEVINTIEKLVTEGEKPGKEVIEKHIELLANIKDYENSQIKESDVKVVPQNTDSDDGKKDTSPVPDEEKKKKISSGTGKDLVKEEQNGANQKEARADVAETRIEPEQTKNIKGVQETIRLPKKKIEEIYLLAEESLQIKLSHNEEINTILSVEEELNKFSERWAKLQVSIKKNTSQTNKKAQLSSNEWIVNGNSMELMEQLNDQLKSITQKLNTLKGSASYVSNTTQNILDNLIDEVKYVLMVPFSNLLSGFPRMVRDLAKDMNKKVSLDIRGEEIEVDRRIMEEMKDPLIHLIRNCIDHGIEDSKQRIKAGKSETGKIEITIVQLDSNFVQIVVSDDGGGIDSKRVIEKAVQRNLILKEEAPGISNKEALQLVFKSGLSTSSMITDISGRGLGLAIVEEKVDNLGGKIIVESEKGKGSKFSINVPVSIAKSRGLIVKTSQGKYILPVSNVIETLRVKVQSLKKVENQDTIQYKGNTLPLVPLSKILENNQTYSTNSDYYYLVVLESLNKRIGFLVEDIINEQEVLLKPLNYPIKKVENVTGVSLLGTGEVCPILNVHDLINSALLTKSDIGTGVSQVKKEKTKQKSILIAEDSITSRLFLKNILEGAGYKVKAVVDGKEAFTSLKQGGYDLLVSDVEMPRMNGFELTEAVRGDEGLKKLPVVLVTSLSKREDQEKGIDAGANAYIVKGSFEQSNLLGVISRLI